MDSTPNTELGHADEKLARLEEQLSKLGHDAARHPSDPVPRIKRRVLGDRPSHGGWARRGLAGLLLAACIGIVAITWWQWQSYFGDTAKTAPPQPAPLAQTAPPAALSPELTELRQRVARDLATVGQGIEQLTASQEKMARDNANVAEQLKASQEQMVRVIANISEQLKASQEQMARDNANVSEQLKASQEQLARVIAQVSEPNARPKIAAPAPRPTAIPTPKPVPTPSSPKTTAQPQARKPQLSSASPAPVR